MNTSDGSVADARLTSADAPPPSPDDPARPPDRPARAGEDGALERRVLRAKGDPEELTALLAEYRPFLLAIIAKTLPGRPSQDGLTVAMEAFVEAVGGYEWTRAAFIPYAALVIRRRLIDAHRRESDPHTVPAADVSPDPLDESAAYTAHSLRAHQKSGEQLDTREEIIRLGVELSGWGLTYRQIAAACPKQRRTRASCQDAAGWLINDPERVARSRAARTLPIGEMALRTGVPVKLLEKHRRYLVAALLICSGDYPILREYIPAHRQSAAGERSLRHDS